MLHLLNEIFGTNFNWTTDIIVMVVLGLLLIGFLATASLGAGANEIKHFGERWYLPSEDEQASA